MKKPKKLANPKDNGGGGYDNDPVGEAKWNDAEEAAAEGDDKYLSEKDQDSGEEEASAVFEMQSGAPCGKRACIEHIPELEEHEGGEEELQLIVGKSGVER